MDALKYDERKNYMNISPHVPNSKNNYLFSPEKNAKKNMSSKLRKIRQLVFSRFM